MLYLQDLFQGLHSLIYGDKPSVSLVSDHSSEIYKVHIIQGVVLVAPPPPACQPLHGLSLQVSAGSECIAVPKNWVLQHMDSSIVRHLQKSVSRPILTVPDGPLHKGEGGCLANLNCFHVLTAVAALPTAFASATDVG